MSKSEIKAKRIAANEARKRAYFEQLAARHKELFDGTEVVINEKGDTMCLPK